MAQFGKRGVIGGARPPLSPQPAAVATMAAPTPTQSAGARTEAMAGMFRTAIFLLLAGAAYWFLILPYAGGVVRDLRLSGTWQPAYDMQVVDGRCKRYNFVITLCSARMKSRARPDLPPTSVDYMMAFVRGAEPLVAVRSTRDTSAVSIGAAADRHLVNRTLTFLFLTGVFIAIFLVCGLLMLAAGNGRAADREAASGAGDMKGAEPA